MVALSSFSTSFLLASVHLAKVSLTNFLLVEFGSKEGEKRVSASHETERGEGRGALERWRPARGGHGGC
jgi:hypothetical protein